ncbi:MAG: type II toxin-antitoxin system RelE/ParE family toxin [Flavobacteriaceae bacterium]|nr:type II toxin-antitoxin system RelE/ParE family toxin [Flavobacteriaceae bacterium]
MTYSIDIAEAAEKDVHKAFLYYEDKKEDLGYTFETHFDNAVDSIQSNPLKTQIRYADTRVFFLKKFPYGIHFQVKGSVVLIIAVFRTSEDPEKWTER